MIKCLLAGACLLALPVRAVADESIEKLTEDILNLNTGIEAIRAQISDLSRQIADKSKSVSELEGQFKRAEMLADEMRGDIAADSIEVYKKRIADKEKQLVALDSDINKAQKTLNDKQISLGKANADIGNLDRYSSEVQQQMYARNKKLLAEPYSRITDVQMAELKRTMGDFSDMPDFMDYRRSIEDAEVNRSVYAEGVELLKNELDQDAIYNLRSKKLIPLINVIDGKRTESGKRMSEAQFSEMDKLDIYLSRYAGGVKVFKELIKKVNADRANAVKIIDPESETFKADYDKYFKNIEWLNRQLTTYRKELLSNPGTEPTATERRIQGITIKN